MKLSEAIRKGYEKVGKQITGTYFEFDEQGNICGACVLGCAYIGAGLPLVFGTVFIDDTVTPALREAFPILEDNNNLVSFFDVLVAENDLHLTIEDLLNTVEAEEAKHEL